MFELNSLHHSDVLLYELNFEKFVNDHYYYLLMKIRDKVKLISVVAQKDLQEMWISMMEMKNNDQINHHIEFDYVLIHKNKLENHLDN